MRTLILAPVPAALEMEKDRAARAAADLVEDGMSVGLGTGTTVAHLLPALVERGLSLRCVATSPWTEHAARVLGLQVESFDFDHLDIAIDGADQVDPEGWLIKGGGGAHTREKLVAASADRFVVIADSTKPVRSLRPPVPLELLAFGLESTLARLRTVNLRDVPATPEGGVIADFTGEFDSPRALSKWLAAIPGVVEHGLFPPDMVSTILVGRGEDVERLDLTSS